ncbi:hypothetical protein AGLY_012311 [Aphis glycines]|uniref:Uncharacterized protein n=1 Tax=Aphis glycines TaxID=307491 RepID=A0A6G0T9W1_APHGL|nr:hypothetical protein AGLY_012311 [Aphis glycines]
MMGKFTKLLSKNSNQLNTNLDRIGLLGTEDLKKKNPKNKQIDGQLQYNQLPITTDITPIGKARIYMHLSLVQLEFRVLTICTTNDINCLTLFYGLQGQTCIIAIIQTPSHGTYLVKNSTNYSFVRKLAYLGRFLADSQCPPLVIDYRCLTFVARDLKITTALVANDDIIIYLDAALPATPCSLYLSIPITDLYSIRLTCLLPDNTNLKSYRKLTRCHKIMEMLS